jgi:hypothetical protein
MFSAINLSSDSTALSTALGSTALISDFVSVRGNGTAQGSTTINGRSSSFNVDSTRVEVRADFTGDGVNDLLKVTRATGAVQIFPSANQQAVAINLPALPATWDFSGLADADGNGVPDLFWTNPTTQQSAIWVSTGNAATPFFYGTGAIGDPKTTLPASSTTRNTRNTRNTTDLIRDRFNSARDRILNRR